MVTVGDSLGRVAQALSTALGRAHVVITTWGLGPTADDVTRDAAAQATGRDLVFVPEPMAQIEGVLPGTWPSPSPSLLEAGTGGLIAQRLTALPGAGERVHALVTRDEAAARFLGTADGSSGSLAQAAREWGKTDLGAAAVIGPAEGKAPSPVYPTRIGVATTTAVTQHEYRFGGDLRQVRIRARIMTLDRLRRVLMARGD